MMTEQPPDDDQPRQVSLGAVLDGIVGSMSAAEFTALAERTGHGPDPKTAAAEALSKLVKRGNLPVDGTAADVAAAIRDRI